MFYIEEHWARILQQVKEVENSLSRRIPSTDYALLSVTFLDYKQLMAGKMGRNASSPAIFSTFLFKLF